MPDSPEPIGEVERAGERVAREWERMQQEAREAQPFGMATVLPDDWTARLARAALSDREQVSGEAEVEAVADALAEKMKRLAGEPSHFVWPGLAKEAIAALDSLRASRQERPPGKVDEQTWRCSDCGAEYVCDVGRCGALTDCSQPQVVFVHA